MSISLQVPSKFGGFAQDHLGALDRRAGNLSNTGLGVRGLVNAVWLFWPCLTGSCLTVRHDPVGFLDGSVFRTRLLCYLFPRRLASAAVRFFPDALLRSPLNACEPRARRCRSETKPGEKITN